jgi:hypothetical protein
MGMLVGKAGTLLHRKSRDTSHIFLKKNVGSVPVFPVPAFPGKKPPLFSG